MDDDASRPGRDPGMSEAPEGRESAVPGAPVRARGGRGGRKIRRDEDAIIVELQDKIRRLEERKKLREMKHDPIVKEAAKLIRNLRRTEQFFERNGRLDLSNSAKAARLSIESQVAKSLH